jgi:hypothetical protein
VAARNPEAMMDRLTEANAQRLADALTRKLLLVNPSIPTDSLRWVVLQVIVDTELVLTGAVQLEDFEDGP